MWMLQKRQCEIEKIKVDYWAKLGRKKQNGYSTSNEDYGSPIRKWSPQGSLLPIRCTVIRFVSISSIFGNGTVVGLNGTLEANMCEFKLQQVSHLDPRWCKCQNYH